MPFESSLVGGIGSDLTDQEIASMSLARDETLLDTPVLTRSYLGITTAPPGCTQPCGRFDVLYLSSFDRLELVQFNDPSVCQRFPLVGSRVDLRDYRDPNPRDYLVILGDLVSCQGRGQDNVKLCAVSQPLAIIVHPYLQRSRVDVLVLFIDDGRSLAVVERTSSCDNSQPYVHDSQPWLNCYNDPSAERSTETRVDVFRII